jgi:multiple sugar transport system ATP-binding protein
VQQVGEPLELYNQPANRFVAGFIGSPAMNFADVTLAEAGGEAVAEAPGLRIVLPGELAARARAKMNGGGAQATLGIRPEDIHMAGAGDAPGHCFEANVEVVEQLGSEILLDTRVGQALMVASIDPTVRVRAHDKLRLALKPERLHLFDLQTEMAI